VTYVSVVLGPGVLQWVWQCIVALGPAVLQWVWQCVVAVGVAVGVSC